MKQRLEWIGGGLIAILIAMWIAGAVFLEAAGVSSDHARPWTMLAYAEYSFMREYWYGVVSGAVPIAALLLVMLAPKKETVHGDARWAKERDVVKAKLRDSTGVLLGAFNGKFLRTNDPAHFLVCAPTRTGKGVGIIIPNLLSFAGSCVVYDIKFENFEVTSRYRHMSGQKVFLWSPMNPDARSHRYNPLDMVRRSNIFRATDLQMVASFLIPLPEKDPIWDQLARQFFVGVALYVIDRSAAGKGPPATLGEIYRTISSQPDMQAWATTAMQEDFVDAECKRILTQFAGRSEKERSFVQTGVQKALTLWSSPLVDKATEASDFNLRDLRRERMTIYVGVTADQRDVLGPLVGLFFQQVISALSQKLPGSDEPHKVLILMDEFASMGKLEVISNAVTMLAGYGGRMMFIVQALTNIEEKYGKTGRENIIQNCRYQVFLAGNDETTTKYVVYRLGKKTVKTRNVTRNASGTSRSVSEAGRDLMLPQEFQRMPTGNDDAEQVVIVGGSWPVHCRRITYFKDDAFRKRLLGMIDVPPLDEGLVWSEADSAAQAEADTRAVEAQLEECVEELGVAREKGDKAEIARLEARFKLLSDKLTAASPRMAESAEPTGSEDDAEKAVPRAMPKSERVRVIAEKNIIANEAAIGALAAAGHLEVAAEVAKINGDIKPLAST